MNFLFHLSLFIALFHAGLPGARSKISGPNVYRISGHFRRFHEPQDTENARFSVLINVIH